MSGFSKNERKRFHQKPAAMAKGRVPDLAGQEFGRWMVIERVGNSPDGTAQWSCRCACGTERIVKGKRLLGGTSRSCGCMRNELDSTRRINRLKAGSKFGEWEIIGFDSVKNGKAYWLCRCSCGTTRSVIGANLTRGVTQSCGRCRR